MPSPVCRSNSPPDGGPPKATASRRLRIGVRAPDPDDFFDRAVDAAASADVAVVVVGTNDEWETEGFDREIMDLPGEQNELVEAVVAANPNTVVVVNAGSPVTMDWASDDHGAPAPAVITSFFAGQEQAEAMTDVLFGRADPGGRLSITYPKRLEDHAAFENHQPDHSGDGPPQQRYAEGLFIGHRHFERAGVAPQFWLGHGLSYGVATWGDATASSRTLAASSLVDQPVVVEVPISVSGDRDATVVVQGYVAAIEPSVERPVRELKAWAKLVLAAGAGISASLEFGAVAFRHWDGRHGCMGRRSRRLRPRDRAFGRSSRRTPTHPHHPHLTVGSAPVSVERRRCGARRRA